MVSIMANAPTKAQKLHFSAIVELGCIVDLENVNQRCASPAEVHHIETGAGGRRNHDRVIPLCTLHHRCRLGIHHMGRRAWQSIYGTEQELFEKTKKLLTKR